MCVCIYMYIPRNLPPVLFWNCSKLWSGCVLPAPEFSMLTVVFNIQGSSEQQCYQFLKAGFSKNTCTPGANDSQQQHLLLEKVITASALHCDRHAHHNFKCNWLSPNTVDLSIIFSGHFFYLSFITVKSFLYEDVLAARVIQMFLKVLLQLF